MYLQKFSDTFLYTQKNIAYTILYHQSKVDCSLNILYLDLKLETYAEI